jgi:hypothetical protein
MGIEKVSSTPLRMGPEPIPAAHGDFGQLGGFFLAEAATIGHALVRSLSNDDTLVPPASSALYKFGNPLGRTEFAGVLATAGSAPQLANAASAHNDEDVLLLHEGYCPVLLAAGYIAEKHQFLEPIPDGSGEWRPVLAGKSGPAQSLQLVDNSAGSTAVFCGVTLYAGAGCCASGSGASVADSAEVSSTAAVVTFNKALTKAVPKFSQKAGSVFRLTARFKITGKNGSDTISKLQVGLGVVGANAITKVLGETDAITFADGDMLIMSALVTTRSVTTGATPTATVSSAGTLVGGQPATVGYAGDASVDSTTFRVDSDWDAVAGIQFSSSSSGNKAKLINLVLEQIA